MLQWTRPAVVTCLRPTITPANPYHPNHCWPWHGRMSLMSSIWATRADVWQLWLLVTERCRI